MSGPTVDNRYPAAPLTFERPGELCNPFSNGAFEGDPDAAGVPVRILAVDIVDQVPAGAPVFRVVPAGDPTGCGSGPGQLDVVGNCVGAVLTPYRDDDPAACALGITFDASTDHVARVRFSLESICTDAVGAPCSSAAVAALGPTPAEPVTARWTTTQQLAACPQNPPAGAGGSCSQGDVGG